MLEENSLIEAGGMAKNFFQRYLIYIGLFLAGAILTPILLGILNGDQNDGDKTGDRQNSSTNDFAAPTDTDQTAISTFEPNDKQADILKDYETTSPKALSNLPTTIPQYALNQPRVKPYPNYWANIPQSNFNFVPSPSQPKAATSKFATPKPKSTAIQPSASLPASFSSSTPTEFVPPKNAQQNNPDSIKFSGNLQTSGDFNLQDFLNAPTTDKPAPDQSTTDKPK